MITQSEAETRAFGSTFAKTLTPGAIVALYGDLGAGKTTLAKGIVEQLTSVPHHQVQSPTFTYLQMYGETLYHFDLYRLKNKETFTALGFLDFFETKGICLIEWPDRIAPLLPKSTISLTLSYEGEMGRRIDVQ